MTFKPSKYQQAIYDWVKNGQGNAIIQAVAGSGKTSTIVASTNLLPKNKRCLFVAFNKSIADELKTRLRPHIQAKTLHSLGLGMFRNEVTTMPTIDGSKVEKLIESELEDIPVREQGDYSTFLRKVIPLIKNMLIDYTNLEQVTDVMAKFNIEFDVDNRAMEAIKHIIVKDKENLSLIDFDDMIYLPVVRNFKTFTYDWVFVDELQDINACQRELIKKVCGKHTRIVGVGDMRQCQPAGTKIVLTGGAIKNIEDVKINDSVVSFSKDWRDGFKGINEQGRKIIDKNEQMYSGQLYTVIVDGRETKCTPNHKWPVRLNGNEELWITYLMKKNNIYRIGQCKLWYKVKTIFNRGFALASRVRQEEGESAWILGIYNSEIESKIQEQILSYNFGIPTLRFVPANPYKWQKHDLMAVFNGVEYFEKKAISILNHFNRDIHYPLWSKYSKNIISQKGAKKTFEVETCNLIPNIMSISWYNGKKEMDWKPLDKLCIDNVTNIIVYSLKVDLNETYVADGLLTHNSIYAFRGADTDSMYKFKMEFDAKELPLSICYRCPRSHIVLAKEIVPEIEWAETAAEGVITNLPLTEAIIRMNEKDLVLCRTNAPLIKVAFAIIRQGKKAIVRGRDIGKGLLKLIEKYKCDTIPELYLKLETYKKLQEEKLELIEKGKLDKKKKGTLLANVDTAETILTIMEDCEAIDCVKQRIETIFSDDKEGIVCSSVHRAKGLEADNVFIINRDNMPHPMAKTDEEIEQEMNILYVALTRSKNELCLVKGLVK